MLVSRKMLTIKQLFCLLILYLNQLSLTQGQALGNGVSKHTWAASDPRVCYDWFFKFIPVTEEAASCDDGICECATQVRLEQIS